MRTKKLKLDARQKKAIQFLSDLRTSRTEARLNQSEFWHRYGVTQSGGSRYESGRDVPTSTRILMALHFMQVISDEDLARAHAVATFVDKADASDE